MSRLHRKKHIWPKKHKRHFQRKIKWWWNKSTKKHFVLLKALSMRPGILKWYHNSVSFKGALFTVWLHNGITWRSLPKMSAQAGAPVDILHRYFQISTTPTHPEQAALISYWSFVYIYERPILISRLNLKLFKSWFCWKCMHFPENARIFI